MNDEKIQVRATSSGQLLSVVVLSKRLDMIQVVLGEGVHNVRCDLTPTRNGSAYVGNAMGREIVPNVYPQPAHEATSRYVHVFLRALGVSFTPYVLPADSHAPVSIGDLRCDAN